MDSLSFGRKKNKKIFENDLTPNRIFIAIPESLLAITLLI